MFSFIWNFIKLLRYILPFLHEVTDIKYAKNEQDKMKIQELRSILKVIAYRFLFFIIFLITVFFVTIPLYTENKLLDKEVNELTEVVSEYRNKVSRLEQNYYIANNRNIELSAEVTLLREERVRLHGIATEYRLALQAVYDEKMGVKRNKKDDKIDHVFIERMNKIK